MFGTLTNEAETKPGNWYSSVAVQLMQANQLNLPKLFIGFVCICTYLWLVCIKSGSSTTNSIRFHGCFYARSVVLRKWEGGSWSYIMQWDPTKSLPATSRHCIYYSIFGALARQSRHCEHYKLHIFTANKLKRPLKLDPVEFNDIHMAPNIPSLFIQCFIAACIFELCNARRTAAAAGEDVTILLGAGLVEPVRVFSW